MSEFDDICNTITSGSADRLSERLFVRKYLPLLMHSDPAAFNFAWLNEVCRSPHARVYIVNDANQIIYSIPPLRSSPFSENPQQLVMALNYIQLETNMMPIKGDMLLEQNLPKLINIKSDSSTYLDEWKAILDRYGLSSLYETDAVKYKNRYVGELEDSDDGW